MAVEAPPVVSTLRAPDGRPAVQIYKGHPHFKEIDRSLKKSQAGPGMFVSRKDPATGALRLYPALVPVTRVERDLINEERTVDLPVLDDQGRVLMQLDPAARVTVWLENDGNDDADSMATTPFPDSKDAMASGIEKLGQIVVEQGKQQAERFEALTAALVSALKERK